MTASVMIDKTKQLTQNQEAKAVQQTRIPQALKERKPEELLLEVRNRKI
jgi:hypothetical protein